MAIGTLIIILNSTMLVVNAIVLTIQSSLIMKEIRDKR